MVYQGQTRSVCDDNWSPAISQVCCRELYGNPEYIRYTVAVQAPHPGFWVIINTCRGTESNLQSCPHQPWGRHNCGPNEGVYLECAAEYSFTHEEDGTVNILRQSDTRGVCDQNWSAQSSRVFCQQKYGRGVLITMTGQQCTQADRFWLTNVACIGTETNLLRCPHSNWGRVSCTANQCLKIFCDGAGPVEYSLQHESSGLVSLNKLRETRGVCGDEWTEQNSRVFCLERYGSPNVIATLTGQTCTYSNFWVQNIVCQGTESRIGACAHSQWGSPTTCQQQQCVKVYCQAGGPVPETGQLVHNEETGILSYSYIQQVKALCDESFDSQSASVACNELYQTRNVVSFYAGQNCDHQNFWISDIVCDGSEDDLNQCTHSPFGENTCSGQRCVALYCQGSGPIEYQLTHQLNGEVCLDKNGQVKDVCGSQWTEQNSRVFCQELYGSPEVVVTQTGHTCSYSTFWIDNLQCAGSEQTIAQCSHPYIYDQSTCQQDECVRVFCRAGGPVADLGQVVHNQVTGVLSYTYLNQERALCDQGFNSDTAAVTCFELYGTRNVVSFDLANTCDHDNFWLSNVQCTGNEDRVSDCSHSAFGVSNCNEQRCVALYCLGSGPLEYELSHRPNGEVSLNKNGQIRGVCGSQWTDYNSGVFCLELYGSSDVVVTQTDQSCSYQSFWIDNLQCQGDEQTIGQCSHPYTRGGISSCQQDQCVRVFCRAGGPTADLGQVVHNQVTGIISYTYLNSERSLCDQGFNSNTAAVTCFELYGTRNVVSFTLSNTCDHDNFWLSNVQCSGDEDRISECQHSAFGVSNCNQQRCVELYCDGSGPVEYQLSHRSNGEVSLDKNGQVRGVCANQWEESNSRVFCLELYGNSDVVVTQTDQTCSYLSFWIENLLCVGTESTIGQCAHTYTRGQSQCQSNQCVRVFCRAGGPIADLGDTIHHQITGVLSYNYMNQERALCDEGFDANSAEVICFELYGTRNVVIFSSANSCVYDNFWLSNLQCTGNEDRLSECQHSQFGEHDCDDQRCVALYCQGAGPVEYTLVHESDGLVSLNKNEEVRGVCGNQWNDNNSRVFCLELYGSADVVVTQLDQTCSQQTFWVENLQCVGTENRLGACPHNTWGSSACQQEECVKVFCQAGGPVADLGQIVHNQQTAVLSYTYMQQTRALCDEGFNRFSAAVACFELYGSRDVVTYTQGNRCTHDNFWVSEIQCTGNEDTLSGCLHSPFGVHNCNDQRCVTLYCGAGGPELPSSLSHSSNGLLSITMNGMSKSICDDNFSQEDAEVACQQLYGDRQVVAFNLEKVCDHDQFWLSNIRCNGQENTLTQCPHDPWGSGSCNTDQCVQVFCLADGPQSETSPLFHGPTGQLKIRHNSEIKEVCDTGFGEVEAQRACFELYGDQRVTAFHIQQQCDSNQFWVDNLRCQGHEERLSDCAHSHWGSANCNQNQCVQVLCLGGGYGSTFQSPRLVHTANAVLNLRYREENRGLCHNSFEMEDAQVACRELYGRGGVIFFSHGHDCGLNSFWIDHVECVGTEASIADCVHGAYGEDNCNPRSECVQLYCQDGGPQPPRGTIAHSSTGILSMIFNGQQKSICGTGFTQQSAQVACQELYQNPNVIHLQSSQQCDSNTFWLDNIRCHGSEIYLSDCPHGLWGQHSCNQQNGCVQVFCEGGGPNQCVLLYSQCNYQGERYEICANTPNLALNFQVKSMRIPHGMRFRFYSEQLYSGERSNYFYEDVQCIDEPIGFSLLAAKLTFSHDFVLKKESFLRKGRLLKKNRKQ